MGGDVLIVDDDNDLLDSMAELVDLLVERRVCKARSVAELVGLGPRALACELAILDVNLGRDVPSGLDALRWLSEQHFAGRVVFLTGHAPTFPQVQEARALRGVELLAKPLSSEQLLAVLRGRQ
jgi:DNA-binding NtrC family response regulator